MIDPAILDRARAIRDGRAASSQVPMPVATTPRVRAVTQRHVDVLRCIAAGSTNEEIALELNVCLETVKAHVANLLDRLGARNRAHAVALAFRAGVLT